MTATPSRAHASLMLEQARVLVAGGELTGAIRICQNLVNGDPEDEMAWLLLGHIHREQGDWVAAKSALDKAIMIRPELATAYYSRAGILQKRRQFKAALRDYQRAVEIDPALTEGYIDKGGVHYQLGEFQNALECAEHALRIEPDNIVARRNRGLMLRELGEMATAERVLRDALALHPDHAETRCSLAMVLIDQGLFDEAEMQLGTVLAAAGPTHVEANWLLSMARLVRGNFRHGWPCYGSRLNRHDALKLPYQFPVWDGSSRAGVTLLIYAEQGLGDDILFASCVPDVLPLFRHCVLECDSRLVELFRRSFPAVTITGSKNNAGPAWSATATDSVVQIAAGSLPGLFRKELSDFPAHAGYLTADPSKVENWRSRLSKLGAGLKVGIAWTGGSVKTRRRIRSLTFLDLLPVLHVPNVHFVSLQYGKSKDEIAALRAAHGVQVHHWQDAIDDYDETAALVSALDLVISVCTSVVHLSGALGRPVWVMVPGSPEWRYLDAGERLPWYPSARLYRQQRGQGWGPVVAAVAGALNQLRKV
jgi:Flp pilus assembly protein TadD